MAEVVIIKVYCYFMYVRVCMHAYMYTMSMSPQTPRESTNLLELELWMVVSHHLGAGN